MAVGFDAELPDLKLTCDGIRGTGDHAIYLWTLKEHHVERRNFCKVSRWDAWDMDVDLGVTRSLG